MGKIDWGTTAEMLLPVVSTVVQKHFGGGDAEPNSFKRGGLVKKTGKAKVHKGERVLTKAQNKKYQKSKAR
jgi:hypothetical protein